MQFENMPFLILSEIHVMCIKLYVHSNYYIAGIFNFVCSHALHHYTHCFHTEYECHRRYAVLGRVMLLLYLCTIVRYL